jgi:ABC-type sugar transport system ATPase subunit
VELVELLGGEALVHLTHGLVELTARLPAPVPQAGEPLRVRVRPAAIHLFDATTTARLSP